MRSRSVRGLGREPTSSASCSNRSGTSRARHPGQLTDPAVEALQVLDIDGRPDVDAGREARDDVIALAPGGARGVGVRELVDIETLGPRSTIQS